MFHEFRAFCFVLNFVRAQQMMAMATSAAYIATSQELDAAGSCGFVLPIDLDKEGRRVPCCGRVCSISYAAARRRCFLGTAGVLVDGWGVCVRCGVLYLVDDLGINDPALTLNFR